MTKLDQVDLAEHHLMLLKVKPGVLGIDHVIPVDHPNIEQDQSIDLVAFSAGNQWSLHRKLYVPFMRCSSC